MCPAPGHSADARPHPWVQISPSQHLGFPSLHPASFGFISFSSFPSKNEGRIPGDGGNLTHEHTHGGRGKAGGGVPVPFCRLPVTPRGGQPGSVLSWCLRGEQSTQASHKENSTPHRVCCRASPGLLENARSGIRSHRLTPLLTGVDTPSRRHPALLKLPREESGHRSATLLTSCSTLGAKIPAARFF